MQQEYINLNYKNITINVLKGLDKQGRPRSKQSYQGLPRFIFWQAFFLFKTETEKWNFRTFTVPCQPREKDPYGQRWKKMQKPARPNEQFDQG